MPNYRECPDIDEAPQLFYAWTKLIATTDGDTAFVERDLGHGVTFKCAIRLEGFDAPELFRPDSEDTRKAAIAAKERLDFILRNHQPFLTQTLYTEKVSRGLKSFDRWRTHIWILDDNGNYLSVAKILKGEILLPENSEEMRKQIAVNKMKQFLSDPNRDLFLTQEERSDLKKLIARH